MWLTAEGMSQEFNKFFGSVFTKETSGEVPEADWMYKENDRGLCDIEITEKIVFFVGAVAVWVASRPEACRLSQLQGCGFESAPLTSIA